jgi:hypothetical protein
VVDVKVLSKPSQTSPWRKSTTRMLLSDPIRQGFPTNPSVIGLLDELKGDDVWLGGVIDQDLFFLSTKGILLWLGRIGDSQKIV